MDSANPFCAFLPGVDVGRPRVLWGIRQYGRVSIRRYFVLFLRARLDLIATFGTREAIPRIACSILV
jgi:hypothetical protein